MYVNIGVHVLLSLLFDRVFFCFSHLIFCNTDHNSYFQTSRKVTQEQVTDTTRTNELKQLVSTSGRPSSPTKPLQETHRKHPRDSTKTHDTTESVYLQQSVVTNGYHKTEHEHTSFSTGKSLLHLVQYFVS